MASLNAEFARTDRTAAPASPDAATSEARDPAAATTSDTSQTSPPTAASGASHSCPDGGAWSGGAGPDEIAWDASTAEELTHAYSLATPSPRAERFSPQQAPTEALTGDAYVFGLRLEEIAQRVERSLDALRSEVSVGDLSHRFDQFEQHFDQILQNVATRSDVDGLRILEAHVSEITSQVQQTQTHLSRLGHIEAEIERLRRQLSDEEMVRVFGDLIPTEATFSRIAEDAAERAAKRVLGEQHKPKPSASAAPTETADKVTALHDLVTDLIDARQRSEVATAAALDSVQQAMQNVLDRIDAMEDARQPSPAIAEWSAASYGNTPIPDAEPIATPSFKDISRDAPVARDSDDDAKSSALPPPLPLRPRLAALQSVKSTLDTPDTPDDEERKPFTELPDNMFTPPEITAENQHLYSTEEPVSRPEVSKPSFVVLARRPADPESDARVVEEKTETPLAAAMNDDIKLTAPLSDRADMTNSERKSVLRPSLLMVFSLIAFALAGYWFYVSGQRLNTSEPGTPAHEKPMGPQADAPSSARILSPNRPAEATNRTADAPAVNTPGNAAPATAGVAKPEAIDLHPDRSSNAITGPADREQRAALPAALQPATPAPAIALQSPVGIAIHNSPRPPSPEDIARVQQRMNTAALSERIGQPASLTAPVANAPADFQHPAQSSIETRSTSPSTTSDGRTTLELPPAVSGPLSLRLAAAKGDASAQFDIAARLAEGKGIKQDFAEAARWYQRAAAQGLAAAQYRLAALYERGLGVEADPARAMVWYRRAAEGGNIKAMHNLAVLSTGGQNARADYAAAAQWFTEAAERGLADSQYNLGVLYENGQGVTQDAATAYKWYALAARSGDKEAIRRRDALKAKLEATIVMATDSSVAKWRPRSVNRTANDAHAAGEAWKLRAAQAAQ